jgi:ubiquinol-cytochrome c reductase cytochrome c1 subunit
MKTLLALMLLLACQWGGAEMLPGVTLESPPSIDNQTQALQQGAQFFAQHCVACHSVKHVRYSRLRAVGLTDPQIVELFNIQPKQLNEGIAATLSPDQAKVAFGVEPPDLSLATRSKVQGAEYVYSYLRAFYVDPSKGSGWNNAVFPDTSMPHVLVELQGEQTAKFSDKHEFTGFEQAKPGKMTSVQYDRALANLTRFLVFVSDPSGPARTKLGLAVLSFFVVFAVFAWRLHSLYWKDVT